MNRTYRGRSGRPNGGANGSFRSIPSKKSGDSALAMLVLVLVLLAGSLAGIVALLRSQIGIMSVVKASHGYDNIEIAEKDVFFDGIFVDDLQVGGMTKAEAQQLIENKQQIYIKDAMMVLTYGTQRWEYKLAELPYSFDTDEVIEQAFSLGRQGSVEERRAIVSQLPGSPVKLTTTATVDPSSLEQQIRELAASFTIEPVNACYSGYDATKTVNSRLVFAPDVPGQMVDADALWLAVETEFANHTFSAVPIQVLPVEADLQAGDLQRELKLIAQFSSTMKDHSAPRMANITAASLAINGRLLMPGDIFSFNDTTGERTADKGYKIAHVINGGVTDNGLAGGTCQVSGTLWNAVVRADLEIVERYAHSLRSSYLPLGQDATVDWGHYDLKFRNNTDRLVLLVIYIGTGEDQYKLFAEIYGTPLADGVTIELETEKTGTVPAPGGVSYAPSEAVRRGSTEIIPPRAGVKATTYKIYKKDGVETRRVELHKDYYKEAGTVIVYNPADGKPSATATPTATPPGDFDPTPTLSPDTTSAPFG